MTSSSPSMSRSFQSSKDVELQYTSSPRPSSKAIPTSRERYGSRSMDRSLHHPVGFHDPLKSLSPMAARFVQEVDEEEQPEELSEYEIPARSLQTGGPPSDPLQAEPLFTRLIRQQKVTNDYLEEFRGFTIPLLEKLEKKYPQPDAVESAAFPALLPLISFLKEYKDKHEMTAREIQSMEAVASAFLKTLEWTRGIQLTWNERHELSYIRRNVRYAVDLTSGHGESSFDHPHNFEGGESDTETANARRWDSGFIDSYVWRSTDWRF